MSANFYCWAPTLNLDPKARDFNDRIDALYDAPPEASDRLIAFVEALLARYPDLDDGADGETVWSSGPLGSDISGDFINLGVIWSRCDEAEPFIRETAHKHGLHFYDPQSEKFYPCPAVRG